VDADSKNLILNEMLLNAGAYGGTALGQIPNQNLAEE